MSCCCLDPCALIFELNRTVRSLQTQITTLQTEINNIIFPEPTEFFIPQKLHVREQYETGQGAGNSPSAAWRVKRLNTIITNDIGATAYISDGVVFVPSGTYDVFARSPVVTAEIHRLRLTNNLYTQTFAIGGNAYSANSITDASLFARIVLTQETGLVLQHYTAQERSNGLGTPSNISSWEEVYTELILYRIKE